MHPEEKLAELAVAGGFSAVAVASKERAEA